MQLTTVGTGTAAPHAERVQSATLLSWDAGHLLVDVGAGAVFRMAQLGVPWAAISHVALTHFHADHTSDLANLLYAWRYGLLPPRSAPATVIGPPGTVELVRRLRDAFGGGLLDGPPDVAVVELPFGGSFPLPGGASLTSRKVPHTAESVAYSVAADGKRVVVSGDTGYDTGLGEWARDADVFVCECSLPERLALPTHLTPEQCGALGGIARPHVLALTHFYPPLDDEDVAAIVRTRYDGALVLCHDGWRHDLRGN